MRIVFIESSRGNPNDIKRMEEFASRGYEVAAYAFNRSEKSINIPKGISVKSLGFFESDSSYISRIGIIKRGIKKVLDNHKGDNCIFYLFRNDIAQVYRAISNRPYIFEEADMTHLNFRNAALRIMMEWNVKKIIKHSVMSVFRSEGFLSYHFGDNRPNNVYVIPNRLHPDILKLPMVFKKEAKSDCLRFGFVGHIRYNTILSFVRTLTSYFPHHEFHFFGTFPSVSDETKFSVLSKVTNCFFHGAFKSPDDLPRIYSMIDILLSTYDVSTINPRYAEPNKLYEAIFFDTPIIVSSDSFLANKVNRLGIGYDVDAFDSKAIVELVRRIDIKDLKTKKNNIAKIDKCSCINNNEEFFKVLEGLI